jgi:hypothetical protein
MTRGTDQHDKHGKLIMTSILLYPGELASDIAGLDAESENRQILRMFVNTLFWGTVGTVAVLMVML